MDKWIDFYEKAFESREVAISFVEDLESLNDPDVPHHRAKIMMHQVQRLVSLADEVPKIRKGKESLQLLFLIICAENISKLFDDFENEGKSKAYVRKFFSDFIVGEDRKLLESSFVTHELQPLDLQSIADCVYSVSIYQTKLD